MFCSLADPNTLILYCPLFDIGRYLNLDMRGVVRQESSAHLQDVGTGSGTAGQDGAHYGPVKCPRNVQLTGQTEAPGVLLVVGSRPEVRGHAGQHSVPLRVDEDQAEDAPVQGEVGGEAPGQGGVYGGEDGEGRPPVLDNHPLQVGQGGLRSTEDTDLEAGLELVHHQSEGHCGTFDWEEDGSVRQGGSLLSPDVEGEQTQLVRVEAPPVGGGRHQPPPGQHAAVGAVHALREVLQVVGDGPRLAAHQDVHRTYQVTEQRGLLTGLQTVQEAVDDAKGSPEFSLNSVDVSQSYQVIQAHQENQTLEDVIKKPKMKSTFEKVWDLSLDLTCGCENR